MPHHRRIHRRAPSRHRHGAALLEGRGSEKLAAATPVHGGRALAWTSDRRNFLSHWAQWAQVSRLPCHSFGSFDLLRPPRLPSSQREVRQDSMLEGLNRSRLHRLELSSTLALHQSWWPTPQLLLTLTPHSCGAAPEFIAKNSFTL